MSTNLSKVNRCQFCGAFSLKSSWKNDKCPICRRKYDWLKAQDEEDD